MGQQGDRQAGPAGIFLSPLAQRRAAFDAACAPLFARLDACDDVASCMALLGRGQPDLLVIDIEAFESRLQRDELDSLVSGRGLLAEDAPPTLLLCPATHVGRLHGLMMEGATDYAVLPLDGQALRARVERILAGASTTVDAARQARLLHLQLRAHQALLSAPDARTFAQRLCGTLCDSLGGWPGLLHAAVFHLKPGGDLRLEAQGGLPDLQLEGLLGGASHLLQAPLRHVFPGLQAAAGGQPVLVEAPEQTGEPALARTLRGHGVAMAAGWPIPSEGPGPAQGALSLLFDEQRALAHGELVLLEDLALLAGAGMRLLDTAAENETLAAQLAHATTTDALTGAANRRHGEHVLEQEIRRARRYALPLALVTLDIDRFKAINDAYGHPVGDVALRTVADTVRAMLRASDVLVRSGGAAFHVIAPHTSAADGLRIAEKIRLAIEQTPFPGCDRLTVSLGVAQLGEGESGDSLARRVDAALARAKRAGRNCVELAMQ